MTGVRQVDTVAGTMERGLGVTSPTLSDPAIAGCNLKEPLIPMARGGGPTLRMQYVPMHSITAAGGTVLRVPSGADGLGGSISEYTAVLDNVPAAGNIRRVPSGAEGLRGPISAHTDVPIDGLGGAPWSIEEQRQPAALSFSSFHPSRSLLDGSGRLPKGGLMMSVKE